MSLKSTFLLLLVCFARGEYVSVEHAEYQCPEGSSQYDVVATRGIQCEQLWTHNGTTFAVYSDEETDCYEPCVSVHSGSVRLNACVNVTLTLLCTSQFLKESRIHFTGGVVQNGAAVTPGLPHQEWKKSHRIGLPVVAVLIGVIILVFFLRKLRGQ